MSDFKNLKEATEAFNALQDELTAKTAEVEKLKAESSNERESLIADNSHYKAVVAEKDAQLKEQSDYIVQLIDTLSKVRTEKPLSGEIPSFTSGGKEYEVVIPQFNHEGKIYKAEDVVSDKKLQDILIELGSHVIREKEEE